MLMATYGARVIKVEGTDTTDMGRTWGPPFSGADASFFLGINTGKEAIAIDLKDPRGVELCRELIAKADILIENFRPGTMDRLGLGYDTARIINPRLIYCSISGYGQTGPAGRTGHGPDPPSRLGADQHDRNRSRRFGPLRAFGG